MKTNDIIVLDNGDKFTLLASTEKNGETYFLAGKLKDNDEFDPKHVVIVQAVYEGDEKYIDVIRDEKLIAILTREFKNILKK